VPIRYILDLSFFQELADPDQARRDDDFAPAPT
jgi:hypothetical protein